VTRCSTAPAASGSPAAPSNRSPALSPDNSVRGIRVVCLRPDAVPESWPAEFEAKFPEQFRKTKTCMEASSVLGRLPLLTEVSNAAVLAASARAGASVNLTCASIVDKD
jgi:hypothetical protein